MRAVYAIAIEIVTALVLVPFELVRIVARRSSMAALSDRLGWFKPLAAPPGRRVLIHAVSAGEMNAASGIVHELAEREWIVVLSAGNEDAWAMASRIAAHHPEVRRIVRVPWDRPHAMQRLLRSLRPDVVVVLETEIWPGLFDACRLLHVPLVLAGARIERRAAGRYRWLRTFFTGVLDACTRILAIDDAERDRFVAIGARPERVVVAGNLKTDACLGSHESSIPHEGTRPVVLAANTHPGEEELILAACAELGADLILAPRHVHRAAAIRRLAPQHVTVIDRMGELGRHYAAADVVILGGTFVPIGGHDPLQAARCARAIVVGPHVENIRSTLLAMSEADALSRTDAQGLAGVLRTLLQDDARRAELGEHARTFVVGRRGAARMTADWIDDSRESYGR